MPKGNHQTRLVEHKAVYYTGIEAEMRTLSPNLQADNKSEKLTVEFTIRALKSARGICHMSNRLAKR